MMWGWGESGGAIAIPRSWACVCAQKSGLEIGFSAFWKRPWVPCAEPPPGALEGEGVAQRPLSPLQDKAKAFGGEPGAG